MRSHQKYIAPSSFRNGHVLDMPCDEKGTLP